MLRRRLLLLFIALLVFAAGDASALRNRAVRHPAWSQLDVAPRDVFSYSEPLQIRVTHVALDLTVDFESRRLRGSATLDLNNFTGTNTLLLDTNNLDISRITRDGVAATWSYDDPTGDGQPLRIAIEPSTRSVKIEYATSPDAPGLYWNTAAQSYGRKRPYLYSLSEPNDARSWIPIQDTPSVRMTYDATLHVPSDLLALMSAENNATTANESGVYSFHMSRPIPAYLIAIAVARLEFRPFDTRTGVYAEPEVIDDAEWELQSLPDLVNAGESVAGPFPFIRHDVLLMPPTFVAGGMEHPMLNFISPFSVVTGNHPAVPEPTNLIAHELAHSWAGDQTTVATWEDVWLNEGITSYLALRILEVLQGQERTDLQFYLDRQSYASYANQVEDKSATTLHRIVPFAFYGFNSTSYVKGELFMKTLEDRIGRESFDRFLKTYFTTLAWHWTDDRNFLALLRSSTTFDENVMLTDAWVYGTGLPSNVTAAPVSAIFTRVQQRATAFNGGTAVAQLAPQSWTNVEIDLFLQLANITIGRMPEIDAAFGLSLRVTPPQQWLLATAYLNYEPGMAALERALLRGGPSGRIIAIYRGLANTSAGRARGLVIFEKARDRYDAGVAAQVNLMLNPQHSGTPDLAA